MKLGNLIEKTTQYVEMYYHQHKRDAVSPKIWDLILTIRYLVHELKASEKRYADFKANRLLCAYDGCKNNGNVITPEGDIYCRHHADITDHCYICGEILNSREYCTTCERYRDDFTETDYYDDPYEHDG